MEWTDQKDILMFCEVIGEKNFDHKSGSRDRVTSLQNVDASLDAIDGILLIATAFRDRVAKRVKNFSAQLNSEKKLSGKKDRRLLNMILYYKI